MLLFIFQLPATIFFAIIFVICFCLSKKFIFVVLVLYYVCLLFRVLSDVLYYSVQLVSVRQSAVAPFADDDAILQQ